ncbi:hypothetical protein GCM10027034_17750 [Ramlibacter solisilvae]|uniref:hypothetical protein n=1 Tax=Ramlibacter tataouinensis TaxID=94132 RepID=UPI0007779A77|nr:hypothetical protein [Ramlibacter tataouinensis]
MAGMFASWVHGNALVVEGDPLEYFTTRVQAYVDLATDSNPHRAWGEAEAHEVRPRLAIDHLGWGTVVRMQPGTAQWFHIPIPTPVIHDDVRLEMIRFFLLWKLEGHGELAQVDLYDAGVQVLAGFKPKPGGIYLPYGPGEHLHMDYYSTFDLMFPSRAVCTFGFGISFLVRSTGATTLTVTAAGADFQRTSQ